MFLRQRMENAGGYWEAENSWSWIPKHICPQNTTAKHYLVKIVLDLPISMWFWKLWEVGFNLLIIPVCIYSSFYTCFHFSNSLHQKRSVFWSHLIEMRICCWSLGYFSIVWKVRIIHFVILPKACPAYTGNTCDSAILFQRWHPNDGFFLNVIQA